MRRIVVRALTCSADIITFLKGTLRIHAEELQPGEPVEFAFDASRFPFAIAIFESLLAGVGMKLLSTREEDGMRLFKVEKL
ncbi:MAG: hypothetical protein F9K13_12200 [Candidatus Methylomirabilis oxygeniifera]|nr:MAG: hypothetical protein F9K13_12200 [Candidatus Methylomirabilis oxyfera]